MSKIVVNKGDKYTLWCCTHDMQSNREVELIADTKLTDKDLLAQAEEYMWDTKQPEWGYKLDG